MKRLQRILVFGYIIALGLAWPTAWWIRSTLNPAFGNPINPIESYLVAWPAVVMLGIVCALGLRQWRIELEDTLIEQFVRLINVLLLNILTVASLGFFFKEFDFGRAVVLVYVGLLAVSLPALQTLIIMQKNTMREQGLLDLRVLVVGTGIHAVRALQRLQDSGRGYKIIGYVGEEPSDEMGVEYLGTMTQINEIARDESIDELVLALPTMGTAQIMKLIMHLEELNITIHVVSTVFGVLASNENVDFLGDMPVFTLHAHVESRSVYDLAKRIIDLAGSVGVLVATIPFWPLIALAIRLDSPGAVLFTQNRVGRGGREFKMYKFRTMRTDSDPYSVAPKDGTDPRITKLGALLRKTSIDELPQLLNVINGTMSLVGPRPEMPFIVETYEPWQRRRLDVLPGITGLWQIVGRKDLPLHENLEYDFYYIRNRSVIYDIAILLRTIPAAVFQRGAY